MTEWGIDTLFNPGKRHMDEEKRRLQSTREEIGDSSGGKRIDLESGVVRIARKNSDEPETEETGELRTEETGELTAEESETDEPAAETTAPAGGSAAERARARRLGR